MAVGVSLLALGGLEAAAVLSFPRVQFPRAPVRFADVAAALFLLLTALLIAAFARHRPTGRPRLLWLLDFVPIAFVAVALQLGSFAPRDGVPDGRALFLFIRFMHPGLGVTPLFPVALMLTAFYVGTLFRLRVIRQWRQLQRWGETWNAGPFPGCGPAIARFAASAASSLTSALGIGVALGLLIFLAPSVRPRTLEGPAFDFLSVIAFTVTFTTAAASIWRAARLWGWLSDVTRRLALHPMVWAYDHMPEFLRRAFRVPVPQAVHRAAVEGARAEVLQLLPASPEASPAQMIPALTAELAAHWTGAGAEPPALEDHEPESSAGVRIREHYLALCMAETLSSMCDMTRTMLFIGASAVVAAVLATATYPFQPAGILGWISTLAVATLVVVSLRVIIGIERDEVLSRLAGTKPGRITGTWSLAVRLVGYVLIPLGTLLAAYQPKGAALPSLIDQASKMLQR
jgi:hypothetical protein